MNFAPLMTLITAEGTSRATSSLYIQQIDIFMGFQAFYALGIIKRFMAFVAESGPVWGC